MLAVRSSDRLRARRQRSRRVKVVLLYAEAAGQRCAGGLRPRAQPAGERPSPPGHARQPALDELPGAMRAAWRNACAIAEAGPGSDRPRFGLLRYARCSREEPDMINFMLALTCGPAAAANSCVQSSHSPHTFMFPDDGIRTTNMNAVMNAGGSCCYGRLAPQHPQAHPSLRCSRTAVAPIASLRCGHVTQQSAGLLRPAFRHVVRCSTLQMMARTSDSDLAA